MILVHQPSKIYYYSKGEMEGQYNSYSPVKMIVTVASMKGFCLYFLKMLLIFSELIKGGKAFCFLLLFCKDCFILLRYTSYMLQPAVKGNHAFVYRISTRKDNMFVA